MKKTNCGTYAMRSYRLEKCMKCSKFGLKWTRDWRREGCSLTGCVHSLSSFEVAWFWQDVCSVIFVKEVEMAERSSKTYSFVSLRLFKAEKISEIKYRMIHLKCSWKHNSICNLWRHQYNKKNQSFSGFYLLWQTYRTDLQQVKYPSPFRKQASAIHFVVLFGISF